MKGSIVEKKLGLVVAAAALGSMLGVSAAAKVVRVWRAALTLDRVDTGSVFTPGKIDN